MNKTVGIYVNMIWWRSGTSRSKKAIRETQIVLIQEENETEKDEPRDTEREGEHTKIKIWQNIENAI